MAEVAGQSAKWL